MVKGNGTGQKPPGTRQGPLAPPFPVKGKALPTGGVAPGKLPPDNGRAAPAKGVGKAKPPTGKGKKPSTARAR